MNGFMLWHAQPPQAMGIVSDRRVLRAAEVPPLLQAQQLVEALQALQAGTQARIDAACAQARAEGLAQGLADARAASEAALADALARLTHAHEQQRAQWQQALPELALAVFGKLLGALPPHEPLARLASQAARELLPARTWRLLVHPAQVAGLREQLQALDPDHSAGLAAAEIVADATLAETDCRLLTEFGSADAGLHTQLARLASAWGLAR
ncbi:FliH/SctL family protein [Aquabacterium sp. OR-4]|uniref:FliH/SctL family protein n=1 Tax=Aquabacterium sp. OR-4 TaxID=2978127 RepID=UPI0021B2FB1F|nr:FliH/SctL family protein [Aquabacterium sp. OR-4]MDT7837969.1 FliH/SctL family protein [Aquabacterium sp. OR-4]